MNGTTKEKSFSEKLDDEMNEEYIKIIDIITCLNEFELKLLGDPKYCAPIDIEINEVFAAWNIIKDKLYSISEYIDNDQSFEKLGLNVFEFLFIIKDEDKLNYKRVKEKVFVFDIILASLFGKSKINEEENYINLIKSNKKSWVNIIDYLKENYGFIGFIFCVYLDFAEELMQVIEFLLFFLSLEKEFTTKFDLKDVNKIEENIIANNFFSILKDPANYFYLLIEKGCIIKKLYEPELTSNIINKGLCEKGIINQCNMEDNIENKKTQKEKKEKKNEEFLEEIKEEHDEPKRDKALEQEQKQEKDEIKEKEKTKKEIRKLKEEIKNINNKTNKEIGKLKEEIERLKSENRAKLKIARKNMEIMRIKMSKIESNLNLIKVRSALKAFIDYFCKGLSLNIHLGYEERVNQVINILKTLKIKEGIDSDFIYKIIGLLKNAISKLKIANNYAHDFNLDQSTLKQILDVIAPKEKNDDLEKRLNQFNANLIIQQLMVVRRDFFYEKDILEKKEKMIYDMLIPKSFVSLFYSDTSAKSK